MGLLDKEKKYYLLLDRLYFQSERCKYIIKCKYINWKGNILIVVKLNNTYD